MQRQQLLGGKEELELEAEKLNKKKIRKASQVELFVEMDVE